MSTDRALVLAADGAAEAIEAVVVEAPIAADLAPLAQIPRSRHPAWAYLESLDAETSRPTMQQALGLIARLCGFPNLDVCPWHRLRFEHINAIRAKLINGFVLPRDTSSPGRRRGRPRKAQSTTPDDMPSGEVVKLAPSSARKHMAALRRVMHYAWELGYITQEEYARAVNVKPIKGTRISSSAAAGRPQPHVRRAAGAHSGIRRRPGAGWRARRGDLQSGLRPGAAAERPHSHGSGAL